MKRESLLSIQRQLSEVAADSYQAFAADYDEKLLNSLSYASPHRAASRFEELFPLPRRGRLEVLELGVGTGLLGRFLHQHCRRAGRYRLTGVDISQAMLDQVPDGLYHEMQVADVALGLPYTQAHFDGAIALGLSEYIADVEGWFGALAGALKPGAAWIFTYVPCPGDTIEKVDGAAILLRHPQEFVITCLDRCGFDFCAEERHPGYSHSGNAVEHGWVTARRR